MTDLSEVNIYHYTSLNGELGSLFYHGLPPQIDPVRHMYCPMFTEKDSAFPILYCPYANKSTQFILIIYVRVYLTQAGMMRYMPKYIICIVT